MIIKNITDIIKEAAKTEDFDNIQGSDEITDIINNELKSKYSDYTDSIVTVNKENVLYTDEMVPVFKNKSNYFVEFESLDKYMKDNDVLDIKEAMGIIAESNDIELGNLSLVIESKDNMSLLLDEAIALSEEGDNSLLEQCELTVKMINMLKSEDINVVLSD